jgi:tellurite methyltransferase
VINVLALGTTFLNMFKPGHYHLFDPQELTRSFAGWNTVCWQEDDFPAPGGRLKRFCTLVAVKP